MIRTYDVRRPGIRPVITGVGSGLPAPSAEATRQAALDAYAILDTPPDEAFDAALRSIAAICAVPCAVVAFADRERVWYKASLGTDRDQSPRADSFTEHAMRVGDAATEIGDLRADAHFAGNPFVAGTPFFRFYAGARLASPAGHVLGALGLMDVVPRKLSAEQRLAHLWAARHIESLLELHRAKLALRDRIDDERRRARNLLRVPQLVTDASVPATDMPSVLRSALDYVRDRRRTDVALTVGFIEVNRIDQMREMLGPAISLDIVGEMTRRLRAIVRETDWIMPVAERGVVMLLDGDPAAIPSSFGRRLDDAFARPLSVGTTEAPLTVNAALVQLDGRYESATEIVRDMNLALDEARSRTGRSRVVVGNDERERFNLTADLYAAVYGNPGLSDFSVACQPIVSLHGERRTLIGMEASPRWNHPEHGLLSAETIAAVAPGTGAASILGAFTFATACKQMRAWQLDMRTTRRHWSTFVRVSDEEWFAPGFVDDVERIADESGVHLRDIGLALTTDTIVRDFDRSVEIMKRLDRRGASIVVDRFGTGQTLLSNLHRLPVSRVRTNAQFVSGDGSAIELADPQALTTIIAHAHRFDLEVIADGVATELQRAALAGLGCDAIQGPLIAPALPPAAAAAYLVRRRIVPRSIGSVE